MEQILPDEAVIKANEIDCEINSHLKPVRSPYRCPHTNMQFPWLHLILGSRLAELFGNIEKYISYKIRRGDVKQIPDLPDYISIPEGKLNQSLPLENEKCKTLTTNVENGILRLSKGTKFHECHIFFDLGIMTIILYPEGGLAGQNNPFVYYSEVCFSFDKYNFIIRDYPSAVFGQNVIYNKALQCFLCENMVSERFYVPQPGIGCIPICENCCLITQSPALDFRKLTENKCDGDMVTRNRIAQARKYAYWGLGDGYNPYRTISAIEDMNSGKDKAIVSTVAHNWENLRCYADNYSRLEKGKITTSFQIQVHDYLMPPLTVYINEGALVREIFFYHDVRVIVLDSKFKYNKSEGTLVIRQSPEDESFDSRTYESLYNNCEVALQMGLEDENLDVFDPNAKYLPLKSLDCLECMLCHTLTSVLIDKRTSSLCLLCYASNDR